MATQTLKSRYFANIVDVSVPGSSVRIEEIELTPEAKRMLSTTEEKMRRAFGEPGERRPAQTPKAA